MLFLRLFLGLVLVFPFAFAHGQDGTMEAPESASPAPIEVPAPPSEPPPAPPAPETPAAPEVPTAPVAPVPETPAPPAAVSTDTEMEPIAKAIRVPPSHFVVPAPPPSVKVEEYIGHRFYESDIDSGGWGWVKLPQENWKHARWVALKETPGVVAAPFRSMGGKRGVDQNYEFKMTGYIAPYQVYDPHTNEMLDVFVLEAWEPLSNGPAEALTIHSGPADRHQGIHSSFSSRASGE